MPSFKNIQIEKGLLVKGFKIIRNTKHKILQYETQKGEKTDIKTYISHGKKDYSGQLFSCVAKELNLTGKQAEDLIRCPLSRAEYEKILSAQGML